LGRDKQRVQYQFQTGSQLPHSSSRLTLKSCLPLYKRVENDVNIQRGFFWGHDDSFCMYYALLTFAQSFTQFLRTTLSYAPLFYWRICLTPQTSLEVLIKQEDTTTYTLPPQNEDPQRTATKWQGRSMSSDGEAKPCKPDPSPYVKFNSSQEINVSAISISDELQSVQGKRV
jgi:hypothetical protein